MIDLVLCDVAISHRAYIDYNIVQCYRSRLANGGNDYAYYPCT